LTDKIPNIFCVVLVIMEQTSSIESLRPSQIHTDLLSPLSAAGPRSSVGMRLSTLSIATSDDTKSSTSSMSKVDYTLVKDLEAFLEFTVSNFDWYELQCGSSDIVRNFNDFTKRLKKDLQNDSVTGVNRRRVYIFEKGTYEIVSTSHIMNIALNFFTKYGLLTSKNDEYKVMSTDKPFVWETITRMSVIEAKRYLERHRSSAITLLGMFSDNTELIKQFIAQDGLSSTKFVTVFKELSLVCKCLFWYLRKVCVDISISVCSLASQPSKNQTSALSRLNIQETNSINAVSVGSTKLDSDYDITLYGNYKVISNVIKCFETNLQTIFGPYETSDTLFDTNLYGLSFIKLQGTFVFSPSENDVIYSNPITCGSITLQYTRASNAHIQHVFALMKLLKNIKFVGSYSDSLSLLLLNYIETNCKFSSYLDTAHNLMNFLRKYSDYKRLLDNFATFFKRYMDHDKLNVYNTYISMVNYYGSETYYTRGAFLDVVVNQQTCKNNGIELTSVDYVDSFIENVSDLMQKIHKEKYINRALFALNKLQDSPATRKAAKLIEGIKSIQKGCSQDILKCSHFLLSYNCTVAVTETINTLSTTDDEIKSKLKLLNDIMNREL